MAICTQSRQNMTMTYGIAIIMPDDVAEEKALALYALGADIEKVRPASIVDKKQV
jgi:cysteine synthase A